LVHENSKSFFNLDATSSEEEKKTEPEKGELKDKSEAKGGKKQTPASEKEKEKKQTKKGEEAEVEEKNEKGGKAVKSAKGKGKGKGKESDEEVTKPKSRKGQQPPKIESEEDDSEEEEEISKPKKGKHKESDEETSKPKKGQKPKAKKQPTEEEVIRPKKATKKGKRYDDESSEEDLMVKEDFLPKAKQQVETSTQSSKQQTKEASKEKAQKEISDVKNLKIDDNDSDDSGVVEYACKMCRTKLFTSENLQSHQTVQGLKDGVCRMYFLDKMEWMKGADDAEGRLACPKCDQKLGRFDDNGISCSCGEVVKPAWKVAKSRVDAIGEPTNNQTDSSDDLQFGDSKKKQKKKKGGTKKVTKGNLSLFRNKDYGAKKRESESDE